MTSRYFRRKHHFKSPKVAIPIDAQVVRLKKSFPDLVVEDNSLNSLSVVIKIQPDIFCKEYEVRITYNNSAGLKVYVINEKLQVASNRKKLPHVFDHEKQQICLYSKTGGIWSNDLSIVSTIVPWASEWLFHYEHWLIDGIWRGGGHDEYSIEDNEHIKSLDVK